jgi:hypothetical protein
VTPADLLHVLVYVPLALAAMVALCCSWLLGGAVVIAERSPWWARLLAGLWVWLSFGAFYFIGSSLEPYR